MNPPTDGNTLLNQQTLAALKDAVGPSFGILLDAFALEIDQRVTAIMTTESVSVIKHETHAIKGTAAAYGADSLSTLAGFIEDTCDSASTLQDGLGQKIAELHLVWQQTKVALSDLQQDPN